MIDPTPSVGRIVHYVEGLSEEYPAIITRVLANGAREGWVVLTVFAPRDTASGIESPYDPSAERLCSWHWPERVP